MSIHAAYMSQRNIYDEVKHFQKQEYHSPNFLKIMEWLQESQAMQKCTHIDEVITRLLLKSDERRLVIEATILSNKCTISNIIEKEV